MRMPAASCRPIGAASRPTVARAAFITATGTWWIFGAMPMAEPKRRATSFIVTFSGPPSSTIRPTARGSSSRVSESVATSAADTKLIGLFPAPNTSVRPLFSTGSPTSVAQNSMNAAARRLVHASPDEASACSISHFTRNRSTGTFGPAPSAEM